jgi:hypothetical protein
MRAESPHLTLPELAAVEGAGSMPAVTKAHLQTCASCHARSRAVAADGVRVLAAGCRPSPGLIHRVFEALDTQPEGPRRGWLPGRGDAGAPRASLARVADARPGVIP